MIGVFLFFAELYGTNPGLAADPYIPARHAFPVQEGEKGTKIAIWHIMCYLFLPKNNRKSLIYKGLTGYSNYSLNYTFMNS